ncbi:MAG: DUF4381 domain-containing protein [Methylococcales bacterium]|nr:DUF4381 domain-containing protein [Methylococcales bacterium]
MQAQQLALRDIHLPETLGWWPPAIGWWLLAILIPLLFVLIVWIYRRITRKTAIKTAKKLLLEIKRDNDLDDRQKLIELSALIRRVVVSHSFRNETASLTGQRWLEYLDSTVKGSPFTSGAGHFLADAHYQKSPVADVDISAVINVCENWLKSQKSKK